MTDLATAEVQGDRPFVTGRFLRMLSITLEQLDAVRDANARAEFSGLGARAKVLERETDALEREIEEACLAAFSGCAHGDLAFYLMVFRSLTNLERVGDYAFSVARDLETFAPRARSATLQDVLPLIRLLSVMVERLAYAFAERDVAAAREVMVIDFEQVDALYEQMQRASLTRLVERPEDVDVALTASRMARNLERLGDHLVNVAERLEVLVLGSAPAAPATRS
ncbi:phosphate uptake regulator PhoU [Deinococcus sp. Leaf326]|jgi:phosphate uptake regulator|uniref:phosphate signaling complex PhoU family protein n=1 Tax=Deinococcus sp. Leaf326 TaxID=1736338 RepID=UPI0006FDFA63|nr:phosphate uptake regulator PhoU [Deinococcus sp. Leaf326]KQR41156.1 PhoU family transcriptional regulator [Deinococcus sp. Leaf326]